jgi:hypothetical protein
MEKHTSLKIAIKCIYNTLSLHALWQWFTGMTSVYAGVNFWVFRHKLNQKCNWNICKSIRFRSKSSVINVKYIKGFYSFKFTYWKLYNGLSSVAIKSWWLSRSSLMSPTSASSSPHLLWYLCHTLCYWREGSVEFPRMRNAVRPHAIHTRFWHFSPCCWNVVDSFQDVCLPVASQRDALGHLNSPSNSLQCCPYVTSLEGGYCCLIHVLCFVWCNVADFGLWSIGILDHSSLECD